MAHQVTVYTDGAARGNPGPGGYGIILVSGNHRKEVARGFRLTTNNRMELMAVIEALKMLKYPGTIVNIYSDSRYVVDAVEKGWVFEWEKKNFAKKKNSDLWKQFLELFRRHQVKFHWLKGHNDHPENTRCDQLAVQAASSPFLEEDTGYQPENQEE